MILALTHLISQLHLVCVASLLLAIGQVGVTSAFAFSPHESQVRARTSLFDQSSHNNILILDHLNLNHEKGRHDLVKAFYFELLGCEPDPRKEENLASGKKTLWANIGCNQFHLPEGKPKAQTFNGIITLAYRSEEDLAALSARANKLMESGIFDGSSFAYDETSFSLTDPWGTLFHLESDSDAADLRGSQPGSKSDGLAITDLTLYVSPDASFAGIGRFYERILGSLSPVVKEDRCKIWVGPRQSLTFLRHPDGKDVSHVQLSSAESNDGVTGISNYGVHISMYVANLEQTYQKMEELKLTYVNPRFKRRAYSKEEALEQCMFRCIDVIDPFAPEKGAIVQIEHEIRSVVKVDGTMYRSCPFDEIPELY